MVGLDSLEIGTQRLTHQITGHPVTARRFSTHTGYLISAVLSGITTIGCVPAEHHRWPSTPPARGIPHESRAPCPQTIRLTQQLASLRTRHNCARITSDSPHHTLAWPLQQGHQTREPRLVTTGHTPPTRPNSTTPTHAAPCDPGVADSTPHHHHKRRPHPQRTTKHRPSTQFEQTRPEFTTPDGQILAPRHPVDQRHPARRQPG